MSKKPKVTEKQAKALELIKEGVNPVRAMKQAGYSEPTSRHPGKNLLRSPGAQSYIQQYKEAYARVGITPQFMAAKTMEWLTAQKVKGSMTEPDKVVPDYETQLKAAEMVRTDWETRSEGSGQPKPAKQFLFK